MWVEILCGLIVYKLFRRFFADESALDVQTSDTNAVFNVADRLEKLYGGKAYVGLRIPDADTGSRQNVDIVLVTKGEAVVVSVKNISGFVSVRGDGSWVCEGDDMHRAELYPDPYYPLVFPILSSPQHEINSAAKIANWLKLKLNTCNVLPQHIKADLQELSLAGHSRGGYVTYAVALGLSKITLTIPIASNAAIPVAGFGLPFFNFDVPLEPKFITQAPCSLNLPNNIPQAIIGSQLGDRGWIPCAPPKLSHEEFFNECQPPCGHFVVSGCGHMDILDDHTPSYGPASLVKCDGCGGNSCRNRMRKSVGGVMVAFFKGVVTGDYADYNSILRNPSPNFSLVKNKTCPTSTGNGRLIYSA